MIVFGIEINGGYVGFGVSETLEAAQVENSPLNVVELLSGDEPACRKLVDYFTYLNNNTSPFSVISEYGITSEDIYTLTSIGSAFLNSKLV